MCVCVCLFVCAPTNYVTFNFRKFGAAASNFCCREIDKNLATAEQITTSRLPGSMDQHSKNAPLWWFDVWFVMSCNIMGIGDVLWGGHHIYCGLCHRYAALRTKGLKELSSKDWQKPLSGKNACLLVMYTSAS
jgi:hypothetical protein